jgi:hypothetical protein
MANILNHKIVSGEAPTVGLRVFTNDWEWGTIEKVGSSLAYDGTPKVCGTYCQSWHEVRLDSGRYTSYNCDRLTTKEPK